jgi:methylmalonyl-CoA/ethylmalonyl-CoA epimerase
MPKINLGLETYLPHPKRVSAARPFLGEINQVGIVVRDLRKAVKNYWSLFGIGPWNIYTYAPPRLTDTQVRGRPQPFSMKVALAKKGRMVIEIIEPLSGHSVYDEFLYAHDEGIHHIGSYMTVDVAREISKMKRMGIGVLQSGKYTVRDFCVWFSYMDTKAELGTIIEYLKVTGKRPKPDERFPR